MLLQLLQCLQHTLGASTVIYGAIVLVLLLSLVPTLIVHNGTISTTRRRLKHLRRLGLATSSNMEDQYDSTYDAPEGTAADGPVRIKAIYIHPVKSCGPIEVGRARLTKTGFLYDRCFAFATTDSSVSVKSDSDSDTAAAAAPAWRFISQRTKPLMSQVKTELWLPHKESNPNDPLVQSGGCVVLTFPDPDTTSSWSSRLETLFFHGWNNLCTTSSQIPLIVPLQPTPAQIREWHIGLKTFGIHTRAASGLDHGTIPSVAAVLPKLKQFLKITEKESLTLLQCTPDTLARTDRNLAPLEHIGSPSVHGYTDQQPVHINSLSSIHAVSSLLPAENQPLDALRFRANLWITGAPAYDEESWKRYRIVPKNSRSKEQEQQQQQSRADVAPHMCVVCRTSRCTMPNVDPARGCFDADTPSAGKKKGKPQPSTTLVQYRTVETGNGAALGYVGMHCVPEDRSFQEAMEQKMGLYVEVGDEIEVLERGVHLYGSTGNDY